jgi:hypothetical protein
MTLNPIKYIRALLVARKAVSDIKEANVKAGMWTTEWFGTVGGVVFTIWSTAQGFIDPALSVKIVAGIVSVYAILRTVLKLAEMMVKLTPSTKDDELIAKVEAGVDAAVKPFVPAQ